MAQSSPPAWGFGSSKRQRVARKDLDLKAVGPGSYNAPLTHKTKGPAFTVMGKHPHQKPTCLDSPGAGAYSPSLKLDEVPGQSMAKKLYTRHFQGNLGTGPGGYDPQKDKKRNYSFSMGGRLENITAKKANFQPGAGTYNLQDTRNLNHNKTASFSFGKETRQRNVHMKEQKNKPGSGTYDQSYTPQLQKAPQYRFGSSTRNGMSAKLMVPGPGAYNAKSIVGLDGPQKTMSGLNKYAPHEKEQSFKPGPGTYNGNKNLILNKTSACKIGSAVRRNFQDEKKAGFQTAPGQYSPSMTQTVGRAANWGFGTEKRPIPGPMKHQMNPSPDSYSIPSRIMEGAKTAMHKRTESLDMNRKNNFPGAGQYDLQGSLNPAHARSTKFSFGRETRVHSNHMKEQRSKPGVGTYDGIADLKKSAPKFGFGTSKRPDIGFQKDSTPAPGHYRLPTRLMNVANYTGVNHEEKFKHV